MRNLIILIILTTLTLYVFVETQKSGFGADENPARLLNAQNNEQQTMDIRDFVMQPFIHGVPYNEVVKYDAATTVPVLIEMLKDPKYEAARSQIATTLGMLGSPAAVEPLIELAESGEGELSRNEYNAKTGALGALGLILNRQMNSRAFDYLKGMAVRSPSTTNKIKWMSPFEDGLDERNVEMARTAIIALGFSGRKETEVFLKSLQGVSIVPITLPDELKKSVDLTLKDALITNVTIQKGQESGLKNYFNKTPQ